MTVRASGAHPDVLTVQDAMRQVLDLFELLAPSDVKQDQIAWKLSYASTNSPFTAQGEAVSLSKDVDITVIAKTQKVELARNLMAASRGDLPLDFKAGKKLDTFKNILKRNLNGVGATEIRIFDEFDPIIVTPTIASNLMKSLEQNVVETTGLNLRLGRTREERGSIDGYFVDLGFHYNQPAIRVFDRRTKSEILCRIDEEMRELIAKEVGANDVWNRRRIRVRGRIKYDADGRIVQVIASKIEKVPNSKASLNDIIDRDFTGGLTTEEYLDLLREGNLAEQA